MQSIVTAIVNRAIPVPGEQAAGVRTACGLLAAGADKEEPRGLAGRGGSWTEEAPPLREEPTWGRISGSGLDYAGGPACLRALWRDRRGTPVDCPVAQ
ncbi:hypothetical protein NDU88_005833 [Pleurodeles waltl]|uniref:Uncharacterized protein n=1 Tax=Pleurodeles waltl TaxID=8319 RepID=A0AAV7TVX4_PLEWA|nr:hypothetical protein NDU88_005833 [Pleurodeles waltl]